MFGREPKEFLHKLSKFQETKKHQSTNFFRTKTAWSSFQVKSEEKKIVFKFYRTKNLG